MHNRRLTHFLLALGLLLAQTFAIVHATEHELKPDNASACEICAYAHAGGMAAATATVPQLHLPDPTPVAALVEQKRRGAVVQPKNRGPPALLA